jgi:hypothetical protein
MKWLFRLLFGIFLMFGLSYVPSVTLAQTDEQAQPPAEQIEEGMGVEDGAQTPSGGDSERRNGSRQNAKGLDGDCDLV